MAFARPKYSPVTLLATALLLLAGAACARPATPATPASSAPSGPAPASAPAPPSAAAAAPAPAATAPSSAAPSAPPRTVKVALGVLGTTSDGPMFVAYDRGYFKEQGLDVDLV